MYTNTLYSTIIVGFLTAFSIRVSLLSSKIHDGDDTAKNSGFIKISQESVYFTWRPMYVYDNIFLNYSKNEKLLD